MRATDRYQVGKSLGGGQRSQVHAALRHSDGREVVLKCYPEDADIRTDSRARREFLALQKVAGDGIVAALELLEEATPPVLVLERAPGLVLEEWIAREAPLSASRFLQIALGTTRALSRIHAARLIHRDVCPGNIVVDPVTLQTWLIDFGRVLPFGAPMQRGEDLRSRRDSHTLLYISPEQTERMDRGIDSRSDLYSLGATLYFALTGRPPFEEHDRLALIHAHFARRPVPPLEVRPSVAPMLSRIVMRLLEKAPEERYQLADGLERDLLRCQNELARTGSIQQDFRLGTADGPHRPTFTRLHGRSRELQTLLAHYQQAAQGQAVIVLLEGDAGVGKSALMEELGRSLQHGRSYVTRGHFEPSRHDQPYLGIAQAVQGLVQRLLTETDAQLAHWSRALRTALSTSAATLADLVPDLRFVLGDVTSAPAFGPLETRLRLTLALQRFLQVVATAEHPLVLFLDSGQWADPGSRELLADWMQQPAGLALLLVCAYRDQEDDPRHPLRAIWDALRQRAIPVETLRLQPLGEEACAEMLAEGLGRSAEQTRSLAACVARKTGNTPLLIQQFVGHLYDEGLVRFDPEVGWSWNEAAVAAAEVPEGAVGLLTAKIARLPHAVAAVLEVASCLSSAFDLDALSELSECPREQIETALLVLCEDGLLLPAPQGFRFVHDRIRETAQSLLSLAERARLHRRAAALLFARTPANALDARCFEIAEHVNAAASQDLDSSERLRAVEINRRACSRALAAGAGGTALHYFQAGESQLDTELWQKQPALCFDLYVLGADAAHQCKEFEHVSRCLGVLAERPLTTTQSVQVLARRIRTSTATQPRQATADLTLQLLARFGMRWPRRPSALRLWWEVLRTDWSLRRGLDDRSFRPCAPQNVERIIPMLLLQAAGQSLSMTSYRLILLGTARSLRLYSRFGYLTSPNLALAAFGCYRLRMGGSRARALRYIEAARYWSQNHPNPLFGPRSDMLAITYGDAWLRPRHQLIEPLRRVSTAASEQGDFEYACLADAQRVALMALIGCSIPDFQAERERVAWTSWAYAIGSAHSVGNRLFQILTGAAQLQDVMNEIARARDAEKELFLYTSIQLLTILIALGEYELALREAERNQAQISHAQMGTHVADFAFLHGVAAAAVARTRRGRSRRALLRAVRQSVRDLRRWSHPGSDFVHMHRLLEAERSALRGSTRRALALYQRGANEAYAHGHRHHAALAHERRSNLLRELHRTAEAKVSLRQAITLYEEWGATVKVTALRRD